MGIKAPEPDVLFSDFGDSALIFKLRVWTLVDHMVKVETHIRFEIERLFRDRHIEMPFPQGMCIISDGSTLLCNKMP